MVSAVSKDHSVAPKFLYSVERAVVGVLAVAWIPFFDVWGLEDLLFAVGCSTAGHHSDLVAYHQEKHFLGRRYSQKMPCTEAS